MRTYTVFEPPLKRRSGRGPESFVFVREGFSWSAFLFSGLWMLYHRLWLVFAGYLVLGVGAGLLAERMQLAPDAVLLCGLLLIFLIGLEAGTLRSWTFRRNRWRERGIVLAADHEAAERRFFEAWEADRLTTRPLAQPPAAASPAGVPRRPVSSGPEIVGLFPEPRDAR